jgi:hypothetical protein
MTSIIIIIGAVLVVVGVYRFLTEKNEDVNDDSHSIMMEEPTLVEEEPIVVVNNVVVKTKTETPKSEPVAEVAITPAPIKKKKPYRRPKPKADIAK